MELIKTSIEGISYCENKNGITYYGSFRHPITKKSTRKKLLSKERYIKKNDKDALDILKKIIEELKSIDNSKEIIEDEEVEIKNYMTLNELADLFFRDKRVIKEAKLRSQYPEYNNENFFNYGVIKNKVKNWKKEEYSYNANVRNYTIGNLPVNKINKKVLSNFMNIDINKRPLSEKTKFNVISMISAIINQSIYEDRIDIINIIPKMQKHKDKRIKNPKRKRTAFLAPDKLKFLLRILHNEVIDKTSKVQENSFLAVYLAIQTAGRANTILNIKVNDIDFESKVIHLYNFKANKQYTLSLNDKAIDFLSEKIKYNFEDPYEDTDYVIRHSNKLRRKRKEPLSRIPEPVYEVMDKLFNEKLDKSLNSHRDRVINFHSIRRSIATNLSKIGTPIYNIMLLLNHATTKQTIDYLNLPPEEVNEEVNNLMEEIFDDLYGKKEKKAIADTLNAGIPF